MSDFDTGWKIQLQNSFGDSSYRSQWNDAARVETKMFVPSLGSWIKQRHELAREWIDRRDVGTLESITVKTRQCQIGRRRLATMFKRDEVIRFMRKEGL